MVRREGLVKVLDSVWPAVANVAWQRERHRRVRADAWRDSRHLAYMSPELARGQSWMRGAMRSPSVSCSTRCWPARPISWSDSSRCPGCVIGHDGVARASPRRRAQTRSCIRDALEKDRDRDVSRRAACRIGSRGYVRARPVSAEASQVERRPSSGATGASLSEAPTTAVPKPSSAAPSTRARKRRAIDTLAVSPFVNLKSAATNSRTWSTGLPRASSTICRRSPSSASWRAHRVSLQGSRRRSEQIGRELGVKAVFLGVSSRSPTAIGSPWSSSMLATARNLVFTVHAPAIGLLVVEEEIAGEITDALKATSRPPCVTGCSGQALRPARPWSVP